MRVPNASIVRIRLHELAASAAWRSFAATVLMIAGTVPAAADNDYPTAVRADYVFACMAANGQTSEMLQRCSCSIDMIAEQLSYEEYEKANTILRLRQDQGQRGMLFRNAAWAQDAVEVLEDAQAESTLRCF